MPGNASRNAEDQNMPSYFNESITIDEAVRKPARTNNNKSPRTSRTASYSIADASLANIFSDSDPMGEEVPLAAENSMSSVRSSNSRKQKNRRKERLNPNDSLSRSNNSLRLTPDRRRALFDQPINDNMTKSSRTLLKNSSAASLPGAWSSGDMSGRTDLDDIVETKYKSKQKLYTLMQNLEMEKKKDFPFQASMHPSMRPVSLQVGEVGNNVLGVWKKPDLENTLSKDAPFRRFRLMCGEFVEEPRVQMSIIFLIVLNSITMGIATFDFVTEDPSVDQAFDILDRVFLTIFTIESALQLVYRGPYLFTDRWLVFDFIIVIISWSLESLQIIRAFRIFRTLRLVTRMGPLRSLVMALGEVLPRIYAIISMLALVFYIYAVLFVQLFGHLELSEDYFDSLQTALLTCMQLMTMEWAELAREVMEYYEWAGSIFCSFISITGFIVFNLIVAVVCDSVSIIDKKIRREAREYLQELEQLQRRAMGIGGDEAEELTLQQKWTEARKRINELTLELEEMKENQTKLIASITRLAKAWEQHEQTQELGRKR